ncbi:hypothetical protein ES705_30162 [subsurface metagenome]
MGYRIGEVSPDRNLHRGLGVGGYNISPPVLASLPLSEHATFPGLSAILVSENVDNLYHGRVLLFLKICSSISYRDTRVWK